MGFKKNKIQKTSPLAINTVGVIALLLIFLLGLFLIKNITFFNFKNDKFTNTGTTLSKNINTGNVLLEKANTGILSQNSKIKETKIKDESDKIKEYINKKNDQNKINILIVGRGGGDHDAPNLTDTIILTSINTKTNLISMLSIPRDLYVEYPKDVKVKVKEGKINGLYAKYSYKNQSKKIGMNVLERKITEITGEKIDYFINIDFTGFKKIIDTIGGIKITIPKDFKDNRYPDGDWGYKTLIFKKGTWLFDGENALKYARSRHSTSDFDRSIRQQQVIKAIKNKLTASYFFTSPGKLKELYNVFNNYIYTDIKLSTLIKLAYKLNGTTDYKILSSNMNDSCFYGSDTCKKGGFLYAPQRSFFGGMSVLLAKGTDKDNLNNYKKLHKYTNIVFNSPGLFKENYKINIFNSLKINNLAGALSNNIVRYGFNIPKFNSIGNTPTTYKKSTIYYNNISENSKTLELLKNFTNAKFIKTNFPKYSKYGAKIEIIIGEDYLSDKNPFKF